VGEEAVTDHRVMPTDTLVVAIDWSRKKRRESINTLLALPRLQNEVHRSASCDGMTLSFKLRAGYMYTYSSTCTCRRQWEG
jgi:hypothetical protein